MTTLTQSQKTTLADLIVCRLPKSWAGFPGRPAASLDMRSIAALEKRGLVESVVHNHRVHGEVKDRTILTYRPTDAGRAAFNPMWVLLRTDGLRGDRE